MTSDRTILITGVTANQGGAVALALQGTGFLKWSASGPVNVTIGNTLNVDYGVATCKNATAGAVTVADSGANELNMPITGTAMLTCK